MSNTTKNTSTTNSKFILTNKEWTATLGVATAGLAVGGPLGAAGATVGVVAGAYVAKRMGWNSDDA
jgi:hypothetical protein